MATVNLGASTDITAIAGPRPTSLPVNLGICQTDPMTGACITNLASSVTVNIAVNATPTFAIIVGGTGQAITLDPATSRISVDFINASGALRGGTSVAVRTN